LLANVLDLADAVEATVAFHDIPDDAGAPGDNLGEMVKLENIAPVTINAPLGLKLGVFLAECAFGGVEGWHLIDHRLLTSHSSSFDFIYRRS